MSTATLPQSPAVIEVEPTAFEAPAAEVPVYVGSAAGRVGLNGAAEMPEDASVLDPDLQPTAVKCKTYPELPCPNPKRCDDEGCTLAVII